MPDDREGYRSGGEGLSDLHLGEAGGQALADDDFALAWSEPAALSELNLRSEKRSEW